MAQGDVLRSEKREYREPATGVKVVQLTDAPCHNVHPYYNQEGFVDGSERYVFSSNRSGIGQIYAVEIASGAIVQLTDSDEPPVLAGIEKRPGGGAGSGGLTCDPERGRVYYSRGKRVCRLDIESLREEVVAESPPGCGNVGGPRPVELWALHGAELPAGGRIGLALAGREPLPARQRDAGGPVRSAGRAPGGRLPRPERREPRRGRQPPVHLPGRPVLPVLRQLHAYAAHGAEDDVVHARRPGAAGAACRTRCRSSPSSRSRWSTTTTRRRTTTSSRCCSPYTQHDRDGVPVSPVRRAEMIDVDLVNRVDRRWVFPGREPIHFKCNSKADLWVGDAADPGPFWFEGRGDLERYVRRKGMARPPRAPCRRRAAIRRRSGRKATAGRRRTGGSACSASGDRSWRCGRWCATTRCGAASIRTRRSRPTTGGRPVWRGQRPAVAALPGGGGLAAVDDVSPAGAAAGYVRLAGFDGPPARLSQTRKLTRPRQRFPAGSLSSRSPAPRRHSAGPNQ